MTLDNSAAVPIRTDISMSVKECGADFLAELSRRIRDAVGEAENHATNATNAAYLAGFNLYLAKQRVEHGNWEVWVRENTSLAPRTASAYIRLYVKLSELPPANRQRVAELPVREAIRAITNNTVSAPKATAPLVRDDSVDAREAWAANLRKTAVHLERFAKAVESGAAFKRGSLARLQRALENAIEIIVRSQRDDRDDDARHDADAHEDAGAGDA